ncbi:MAG: hypothetical protein DLM57_02905 [Pseudonocardiales bacterium]|nr:MAG: hypothetical protein DLM57_02905 [Pseudonocardiales bacterium]
MPVDFQQLTLIDTGGGPMDLDDQIAKTRKESALREEQRSLPLPAGVTMVKLNKQVTGLRVGPEGLATLSAPEGVRAPIGRPVTVKRGKLMHSRVRIKLDDGSRLTVRPYLPREKGLIDCGKRDSLYRGSSSNSDDFLVAIFLLVVIVVVLLPAIYLSVRELAGLSPRCKLAASLRDELNTTLVSRTS